MTIVAFEKKVSLKSLSLLSKTIVRQYSVVLNLKKKQLISINGKKKFKRILVEREQFKLRKLPSKDFIPLFSSRRRACLVLKPNRVSEVFKGFKVHDFEYYGQRNYILKWKFNLYH